MSVPHPDFRVAAVVVTFNRPVLLKRCIESLLDQTHALTEIIVVDNAGIEDNKDDIVGLSGNINYIKLVHNVGGAGGFHFGLREAFKTSADAVILMDDDGFPERSAIEQLVVVMTTRELGVVNCLVLDEDARDELCFEMPYAGEVINDLPAARRLSVDGILENRVGAFNGTMISRSTFEKVGNIKAECFIWGDETEYVMRARRMGVEMATVVGAHQFHPRARGDLVQLKPFAPVRIPPQQRSHYFYRNLGFIRFHYMSFSSFLKGGVSYFITLTLKVGIGEALKCTMYYIDGALDTYRLTPSRSTLLAKIPDSN